VPLQAAVFTAALLQLLDFNTSDISTASPVLANFTSTGGTSFWTNVTGFTGGINFAVVTGRNQISTNGGNFIALSAEL
jgi:hypothetical protein